MGIIYLTARTRHVLFGVSIPVFQLQACALKRQILQEFGSRQNATQHSYIHATFETLKRWTQRPVPIYAN